MLAQQKLNRSGPPSAGLASFRRRSARLAHLWCMETDTTPLAISRHTDRHVDEPAHLGAVVTLAELAAQLHVNVQTLYDLRSQGRGPRGFRVGRELRFRLAEVEEWLARLEHADAERHPAGYRAGGPR